MKGCDSVEDREILDLYFSRNEKAIKETELKYGKLIYKISYNYLSSNEDALECANDTYLALWDNIPPNRPEPFISFVCKIARNISIKKFRHKSAKKRHGISLPLDEIQNMLFEKNIDFNCSSKLIGQSINSFLESCDEKSRVIFIKRYWFFDEIEDIASCMEMSKNSVYKKLSATRKRLKIHLEKDGVFI